VNLPVLIHELREALEDDPHEPAFLRTVTRFGYAFLRDGNRILLGSAPLVFRSFPRDRTSTATDAGVRPTAPLPEGFPESPAPHSHV